MKNEFYVHWEGIDGEKHVVAVVAQDDQEAREAVIDHYNALGKKTQRALVTAYLKENK